MGTFSLIGCKRETPNLINEKYMKYGKFGEQLFVRASKRLYVAENTLTVNIGTIDHNRSH